MKQSLHLTMRAMTAVLLAIAVALPTLAVSRYRPGGSYRADDVVDIRMRHAGELEDIFPDKMYNRVRVLIVSGPINGKDLSYMKKIAGRSRVIDDRDKQVDNYLDLDLADARIESGGGGIFSSTRSSRDEINSSAFSSCSHLRTVVLPSRLEAIGDRAFSYCSNLEEVVMGRYVREIGASAFESCSNLKYLDLSDDVEVLGNRCFADCSRLTDVRLPRGLRVLGEYCFKNVPMTRLSLPGSLTEIGKGAFDGTRLTSLGIPYQARIVNDDPGHMTQLYEYVVERDNRYYASVDGVLYDASVRTLITCPPAYRGAVSVPDGVTTLQTSAFYGCSKVSRVSLPSTITQMGTYVFAHSGLTSFTMPDDITVLPNHTFEGCSALTSVDLHDDVAGIGAYALAECINLRGIRMPESLTAMGEHAFYKCSSLEEVTLPLDVTSLPLSAFHDCTSLSSVTLPQRLSSIGKEAFRNCKSLTHISLPASVINIEKEAFRDCKSLAQIDLPGELRAIGDNALRSTAITELVLPASVTSVGKKVTEKCKLVRIVCYATNPPVLEKVNDNKVPLYVPAGSVQLYKDAKNWKIFKNILPIE